MKIKIIPYSRWIIVVLTKTPLIKALEEVGGTIKDVYLVFSSTSMFNINIIKMIIIVSKDSYCFQGQLLFPRTMSSPKHKFRESLGNEAGPKTLLSLLEIHMLQYILKMTIKRWSKLILYQTNTRIFYTKKLCILTTLLFNN